MIKKLGIVALMLFGFAPFSNAQSSNSPNGDMQRPEICDVTLGDLGRNPPVDPEDRCPTDDGSGRVPPSPPPCVPDPATGLCSIDENG
jgi:hypothetical protein